MHPTWGKQLGNMSEVAFNLNLSSKNFYGVPKSIKNQATFCLKDLSSSIIEYV